MSGSERNKRIVASASLGVFQRLVQVASTLVVMPILLRALGPAGFGIWGAAASLAWFSGLADLGTGSALVTLVAGSMARNEPQEARRQITGALGVGMLVAIPLLALALGIWFLGAGRGNTNCYLIALVGMALNVPLSSANNVWMALQKGFVSGFWELFQTAFTTGALISAALLSLPVWVFVAAVYAGLLLANFGSLIHLFWSHPEFRLVSDRVPEAMRKVATSGILYFALGIAGGLSFMLDNVLTLQLLGPEAAAQMTIAIRICMTGVGVIIVSSQPFWPAFTEAAHKADRRWIRATLFRGTALLAGSVTAGSVVLLVFGKALLKLWLHADLGIGLGLLSAVAAWMLAQAVVRLPHLLLNGLSLLTFQLALFSLSTLTAFVLKFALVNPLGVAGILWGTSITVFFIVFPASIWRIYAWANRSISAGKNPISLQVH